MTQISTNEVRFTMRMNTAVYSRLKEKAAADKRSIAKQLEYITEKYIIKEAENADAD